MRNVANPVACARCPLADCPGLRPHKAEEIPVIQDFKEGEVALERGDVLIEQDVTRGGLYTVLEGIMMRYRLMEDGRRQIVNFMFPGDLVGLQGAFGEPASHSVQALVPARLCAFDAGRFHQLVVSQPTLGYDITWLAAKEETALEEHLVALGRRSAKERVAYLALWLVERARGTCMAEGEYRLAVPITQTQISDMLGLSLVHTNRTIKSLERDRLVIWRQGSIEIPDPKGAAAFAKMDRSIERKRPYL